MSSIAGFLTLEPDTTFLNLPPPIKFNGKNYVQWCQSVRTIIRSTGKEGYLTGDVRVPSPQDPDYKNWEIENCQLMCWLINSMSEDIGGIYLFKKTAPEIWTSVREIYSLTCYELYAIEDAIRLLRQGDLTVTQYYNTLLHYWRQIDEFDDHEWKCLDDRNLYRRIVDNKRTLKFLIGLNKGFDDVHSRIMATKPLMSLSEAFSEVLGEERLKKAIQNWRSSCNNR